MTTPGSLRSRPAQTVRLPGAAGRWPETALRRRTLLIAAATGLLTSSPARGQATTEAKVARRVNDRDIVHLLKRMLKASGKRGVPQGGVISPLLSNIYLTEVDAMLERAKEDLLSNRPYELAHSESKW